MLVYACSWFSLMVYLFKFNFKIYIYINYLNTPWWRSKISSLCFACSFILVYSVLNFVRFCWLIILFEGISLLVQFEILHTLYMYAQLFACMKIQFLSRYNWKFLSLLICRYDPQTNRWTKVAPMSTKRLGVAVAVLGGYLYAVGGSDGSSPLNSGELIINCLFSTFIFLYMLMIKLLNLILSYYIHHILYFVLLIKYFCVKAVIFIFSLLSFCRFSLSFILIKRERKLTMRT